MRNIEVSAGMVPQYKKATEKKLRKYQQLCNEYPECVWGVPGLSFSMHDVIYKAVSRGLENHEQELSILRAMSGNNLNEKQWNSHYRPDVAIPWDGEYQNRYSEECLIEYDEFTRALHDKIRQSVAPAMTLCLSQCLDDVIGWIVQHYTPIRNINLQRFWEIATARLEYENAIERLWIYRELLLRIELTKVGLSKEIRCYRQNKGAVPFAAGIYFLFDEELDYIGETELLRRRLYGHQYYREGEHLIGALFPINDENERKIKEARLIRRLTPPMNITHNDCRWIEETNQPKLI